jgi:phage-related protein
MTAAGKEPVKEWLQGLDKSDRGTIGADIKTVQIGWPLGMPLVRKMAERLWEIRTTLDTRIARIFFTVVGLELVLLHGFFKKSKQTPQQDLKLAQTRMSKL